VKRFARACVPVLLSALAACHHRPPEGIAPQDAPPLASFASLHVVVPPTVFVHAADSLGWVAQLGGARATARLLDSAIVTALDLRDVTRRWILPPALVRVYERNPTYATDPYQITADALRGAGFKTGSRYGDPLASQLRTMIALQEDTRFVLLPVALRFEKAGPGERAVLRAALLDARATEARWVADVRGDSASTPAAALSSVADKLADYFAHP
jgi:hypothetical protein